MPMKPIDKNAILDQMSAKSQPGNDLPASIQALWHDKIGNWDTAHTLSQDIPDPAGARIHAYLHRVEGDLGNAQYWYNRAGEKMPDAPLSDEWAELLDRALAGEL